MKRVRIFSRILLRSLIVQRGRTLTTVLAVAVAAALTTAMLNLYVDVQFKLHREFRSYGANVLVTAKNGQSLPAAATARIDALLGSRAIAVPFAFVVAKTSHGAPIIVAGTNLKDAEKLNRWWSVTGWPVSTGQALMGARTASAISPQGMPFTLSFNNHQLQLTPVGILKTGGPEESRIYISLSDFEQWTGVSPSTIEVSITGAPDDISNAIRKLALALPQTDVRPIRQITEAEGRVFEKTRGALLASIIIIVLTSLLCLLTTLTASVLDRRKDFAVMKALGATQSSANLLFASEAAALSSVGALAGYLLGIGLAMLIGRINFHAPVAPRWNVFPAILIGSILLTLLTAVVPMALLRRIQPAVILKGE